MCGCIQQESRYDTNEKRNSTTSTKAFEKILDRMGIPETIYSDQGSEFKNSIFQKLLDKHNIKIIFALGHAPFVKSFNKTMKNRMMKYMKLKGTKSSKKYSKQGWKGTK
jgi:hypothetical protein